MSTATTARDELRESIANVRPTWSAYTLDNMARLVEDLQRDDVVGVHQEGFFGSFPRVRQLSDVAPESVTWVWRDRIPRGKLSEIVGDPGEGKSTLVTEVVGCLTTGRALPDDEPRSFSETVLLLSAEDGAGDTIRPRLDSAGADVSRVHLLDGIEEDGVLAPLDLRSPTHRRYLANEVDRLGPSMVVIDPLTAYLGSTDSHRDSEVRGVLAPLAELADETGTAILAIRHLNKGSGAKAIYRAGGSIGFTAAVRCSMLVGRVDEDGQVPSCV